MAGIHITDIESAINYWRERSPSPDGFSLGPEVRALAEVYALMVFYGEMEADDISFPGAAREAWMSWSETATPLAWRAMPTSGSARRVRRPDRSRHR